MTTVTGTQGVGHFPSIANPQTVNGDPVSGGAPGATIGNPGINPQPGDYAGCIGALSVNGIALSSNSAGNALVDLTTWGAKELANAISQSVPGVSALVTPRNRLQLSSAPGFQITIAGSANILTALGLTAGSFVQ